MNPFKQTAALSSSLLARKGAAAPASLSLAPHVMSAPRIEARMSPQFPAEPPPRRRPAPAEAAAKLAEPVGGPPAGGARTVKASLRLDADRHLKLRLAALHQRRSSQEVLLAALDAYLETCAATVKDGTCACLQRRAGA